MDLKSLEYILVELAEGVAELRISRRRSLNALNVEVLEELKSALEELKSYESIRCLVITGDGDKAFVAGADIGLMSELTTEAATRFAALGHEVAALIESFPVPVLAAVNGYALGGGCELALACDIIYAAQTAKFGQPEVKIGLIPGFGGCVRLPRKIGVAAASEWIYTGEVYSAKQAQALGLVREVLSQDDLMPRVREVAALIAERAPLAIRGAKAVLREGMATDPVTASEIERREFVKLFETEDMREGTKAFVEKREPAFTGR